MRRVAILILLTLVSSSALPFATAVTETQFADGTTTFTHVFSQSGDALTPGVTLPFGASVNSVEFEVEGSASTTTWINLSDDADWNGPGDTNTNFYPAWFNGAYRQNLQSENDELRLKPTETTTYWSLTSSSDVSTSTGGTLNTTAGHFSAAENDLIGVKTERSETLGTGGSWNYVGPIVQQFNQTHAARWTSSSMSNAPVIDRYNASTGAFIGSSSLNMNVCIASAAYYIYDITSDGDGSVWMTSWNYRYISRWTVTSSGAYTCQAAWSMPTTSGTRYPYGIAFDPSDGEMYLMTGTYQSPNYNFDLWKVNRSSPTTALSTWNIGALRSGFGTPSGLDVQMPRITYNVFCTFSSSTNCKARSWHSVYHTGGLWPEHQGDILFPNTAHYGIERIDGEIAFACYYTNYCGTSQNRKVHYNGASAPSWSDSPSTTSAEITSSVQTLTQSISELKLGAAISYEPTGTSIEYMVTNDAGTTWKRAQIGTTVTFANAGTQVAWKAWLNGTASEAPILDTVGLSYVASYNPSGQMRMYYYAFSGSAPVAATVWWNASTPGGSSLDVYWYSGSTVCNSRTHTVPNSGHTTTFGSVGSYLTLCVEFDSGTNNQFTPTLYDINISTYSNAPENVKIDIGGDGSFEWQHQDALLGTVTATSSNMNNGHLMDDAFNNIVPQTGSGTIIVPVKIRSDAAGEVVLKSMRVEYNMVTVNLDLQYDEAMVLHERGEAYEVVTRHVIGDQALGITNAELTFLAYPNGDAPALSWADDGTLVDDDPEDWIIPDQGGTWVNISNGIFEIHWKFRITDDFPEQNNVGFRVGCTDDNGFSPATLSTGPAGIVVNQSYGLGWLAVRDVEGEVTSEDVQNDDWVVAGETIHFQGQVWFVDTEDAPLNSVFDVRVARKDSQGDFIASGWKDNSNANGSFFISVQVPDMNIPEGVTFEVQTYNVRDPTKVMPTNDTWRRTLRVDDSLPTILDSWPAEEGYEASATNQMVAVTIEDEVGHPEVLTLNYWVEADHDSNRNGQADMDEYAQQTMANDTLDVEKVFFGYIDDSRNPNMARVSYYVTGSDPAGNALTGNDGPGFDYDLATYRTRRDMASVFTGVTWAGHADGGDVFSGTDQSISVGLVDANGIIDFEYISLIFDFEGPDPTRDQQVISYSGRTNVWSSEGPYIDLLPTSSTLVTTNDTGLPWITTTFDFRFSWDWPDEDVSDLALVYKELGSIEPTRIEFIEHTFSVENDLVLDPTTYTVEDVAEPRIGPLDDATPVRPDDRLRWSGRVVYEGSSVPAPNDLGITVEVFDGVQYWSDGSLTDNGGFSIEVPLSAASTLQSAETRTFLTGVRNVPGRGEDMTRDTVATTLQLQVDHTPPRVHHRLAPIDVIDISSATDLTAIPVHFSGWEECVIREDEDRCASFSQSPQWVNWVMRDDARTIAAGRSLLAMQLNETGLYWIGEVDLTSDGIVTPRTGYRVGFWVTGHDAAGNEFPMSANTESDPVRERQEDDGDHDLAWVRLGATVAELIVKSVTLSEETLSSGTEIEVVAIIANTGGPTESSFTVEFLADGEVFHTSRITGLPGGTEHRIVTTWVAAENIDRITVVVDSENEVVEVDEEGNSMSAGVSVDYSWGLGWIDNWRQNPLTVIGVIFALFLLPIVATITWKTSLSGSTSLYEDELFEEDEDNEWDDEEEDEDDEGWE